MGLFDSAAEAGWARDRHARRLPRQLPVRWRSTLYTPSTLYTRLDRWRGDSNVVRTRQGRACGAGRASSRRKFLAVRLRTHPAMHRTRTPRARSRGCATRNVLRLRIVLLGLSAESIHLLHSELQS
jgi:hypothetical protein